MVASSAPITVPKTRKRDTGAFVKPEEIIAWRIVWGGGVRAWLDVRVVESDDDLACASGAELRRRCHICGLERTTISEFHMQNVAVK
jgi:hypothetical protein